MLRTLGLASLVLAGCIDDRDVQLPEEPVQVKSEIFEVPQVSPRPLDVLFVVDNSPAMAEHEAHVVENLPSIGGVVDQSGWDMHVGIVTGDVGCAGRPDWRYDDQLTNEQFLISWRHLDDTHTKNYEGDLADHVTRLASVGHSGCGPFRPFDAIVAALDARLFHRSEANLMIIVIGASDDQSAHSVDDVAARFEERSRIITIVPSDAPRIRELAERASPDTVFPMAITDEDLSRFGWTTGGGGWGSRCLESEHLLDLDPSAGLQPNCSVSDVVRDRETMKTVYERVLPRCTGANRPCWRAEHDPINCFSGSRHTIEIDRVDFPPMGTSVLGQCEVAENP